MTTIISLARFDCSCKRLIVPTELTVKSFKTSSSNAKQHQKYLFMYIIKYTVIILITQSIYTYSKQLKVQFLTRESNQ